MTHDKTFDHLREAVRKTLRETLPSNDNGSPGSTQRLDLAGTLTIRIEIVDLCGAVKDAGQ
jgi:hypothetical protein